MRYLLFIILLFLPCVYSYGWVPLIDLKRYNTKKPSEIKILDKKFILIN